MCLSGLSAARRLPNCQLLLQLFAKLIGWALASRKMVSVSTSVDWTALRYASRGAAAPVTSLARKFSPRVLREVGQAYSWLM
jgi:hypothetical protein